MQLTVGMLAVLLVCAVMDCLYRQVWIPLVLMMVPYIIICLHLAGEEIVLHFLCGLAVGGFFCGFSVLTEGQIGKADGLILGVVTFSLGFWQGVSFLMVCFFYAFAAALMLVVIFHRKKQTRMPFVPFMLFSYITVLLL